MAVLSWAAAGVVGVVQIVRVQAVPGPWPWIPAIIFSLGCIAWVVGLPQGWILHQDSASRTAEAVALVLIFLVEFAGALLMGFAAIGLAIAARSRTDAAKEPAADPSAL